MIKQGITMTFKEILEMFRKVKYIAEYDSHIAYYDDDFNELTDLFEKFDYNLTNESEGFRHYLICFREDVVIIIHNFVTNKEGYKKKFRKY